MKIRLRFTNGYTCTVQADRYEDAGNLKRVWLYRKGVDVGCARNVDVIEIVTPWWERLWAGFKKWGILVFSESPSLRGSTPVEGRP